jgi:hypothetical protein
LKHSADLLWFHADSERTIAVEGNALQGETKHINKASISRTYILLSGLALENILKGLAVSVDPSLVNRGKLDDRLKTHRLIDIVTLCADLITLSAGEIEVCRLAQEAIPYWARYPSPRDYSNLKPEQIVTSEYRKTFNTLYASLHECLYFSIRDGWDSGIGSKLGGIRYSKYEPKLQADLERINRRNKE